jgi:alginate lyase
VRYALPQPVTRHAVEGDALVVAGSVPVRRGIAVVAVVGGALSVAGTAVVTPAPQPRQPADVDPALIGLAANSKPVHKHDDLAGNSSVLDTQALARAVLRASEEGRRLAGENKKARADFDAAVAPATASAAAVLAGGANPGVPSGTASMPGQLIDPHDWYLTLPTGKQGSPDTIDGSKLAGYHSKFFDLNQAHNAIMFTANAGGAHTVGSHYPRSELREMNGAKKADWNASSGTHTMELVQAVTQTPTAKPDVICGQIHDAKDDVMQIHLSGKQLTVKYADGKKDVVLNDNYQLGTVFKVRIEATKGHIRVWYNDAMKADLPITATNSYFKAGTYVNSNPSHGEKPSAVGQVEVFKATVAHQ